MAENTFLLDSADHNSLDYLTLYCQQCYFMKIKVVDFFVYEYVVTIKCQEYGMSPQEMPDSPAFTFQSKLTGI